MLHGRAEGDMEGIINVLKPPGMTSSNAVADVRHIFNMKRVGHTGTLDPGAAGVLPICLGRATRLFDYLVDKEKEYSILLTDDTRSILEKTTPGCRIKRLPDMTLSSAWTAFMEKGQQPLAPEDYIEVKK